MRPIVGVQQPIFMNLPKISDVSFRKKQKKTSIEKRARSGLQSDYDWTSVTVSEAGTRQPAMRYCTAQEDAELRQPLSQNEQAEAWKGHKRDGGTHRAQRRSVPVGDRRSMKGKRDFSFDATAGYPGEGPPPGSGGKAGAKNDRKAVHGAKLCYNCRKGGHEAADCKSPRVASSSKDPGFPKTRVVCGICGEGGHHMSKCASLEPAVNLKKLAGGASQIADAVDSAMLPALAPREEEPQKIPPTREELEQKIARKLGAKAELMFLRKDFGSVADKKTVLSSVCSAALNADFQEYVDEPAGFVMKVVDKAQRKAFMARYTSARGGLQSVLHPSPASYEVVDGEAALIGDDLGELTHFESQKLFGLRGKPNEESKFLPLLLLILKVVVEECAKNVGVLVEDSGLLPEWSDYCLTEATAFLICAAFALYEAPKAASWCDVIRRGAEITVRTGLHFALYYAGFLHGVLFHILWNLSIGVIESAWALSLWGNKKNVRDVVSLNDVTASICCEEHGLRPCPVQDGFTCKLGEHRCEPGFGARRAFGVLGYVGTVFGQCSHNIWIGLTERVGKKLPLHTSQSKQSAVLGEWRRLRKAVGGHMDQRVRRVKKKVTWMKWVHGFIPRKRDMLIRLKDTGYEICRATASSFIKAEIALKYEHDMKFKAPRVIQGCDPWLSIETGPWVRNFAKELRDGLGPMEWDDLEEQDIINGRQIYYTCGRNSEDVGRAFSQGLEVIGRMCGDGEHVVIVEDDQSRFDLHLTEGPFAFLNWFYIRKLPRKVARMLKRGDSVGRFSNGTKYGIPYTMQSGWPDTSAGDTAANAAMKFYIHGVGRKWFSIICGDDSVTVTTNLEIKRIGGLDNIVAKYADLGMEVEASQTRDPLEVGFCSGRFQPVGEGYILVSKVGKMVAKLGWDMVDRNSVGQKAWVRGIAATCVQMGGLDPLMASLAEGLKNCVGDGKVIVQQGWEHKLKLSEEHKVDWDNYLLYVDKHYGLCERDVVELCAILRKVEIGRVFDDPRLISMAEKDC